MFEAKFQSFSEKTDPSKGKERLAALRAELSKRKLDGFIIPRTDQHQNEYVPACEERLAWLTGFAGSAGVAVVLADKAALFVDGRYTLEAKAQVDTSAFTIEHLAETPPSEWIAKNLKGGNFGYDPLRTTIGGVEHLKKACERAGATLVPLPENPVDAIWSDRPAPPLSPVVLHDLRFAGESTDSKIRRLQDELGKAKLDATVLSDPASVAWVFNIRGADVTHTPLPLSWALVPRDGKPSLFVDGRKLSNEVRVALSKVADVQEPTAFDQALAAAAKNKTIRLDQATAPKHLADVIEQSGGTVAKGADPVTRMKAAKNEAEIAGTRAAHKRDGAALVNFLAWFDREAPSGKLTEIDAVAALESFRRKTGKLKDVSFPTIAGAGPHGAIVHYRVTQKTNRRISPGELFLIDSGAQYEDGTTDVTRTLSVGDPTHEMRERFTLVLKGHIAIARAVFPEGTTGAQLDGFARAPLWRAGLDFDHGTGHGVGSYLSVHEGPARISKMGNAKLEPGMILSNEPGYYKTDAYGIRIENLELIVPHKAPSGAEKKLLSFEALTLAPINRRLVLPSALSLEELDWLDTYHARVRAEIASLVDSEARDWLIQATEPLMNIALR
ncbi:MAG TPA: aminopeptidase P family protein [Xanthobacteraceae bacterium]|nr:aminopeptidase P family protein [Xanthobacteraceae bacterium]